MSVLSGAAPYFRQRQRQSFEHHPYVCSVLALFVLLGVSVLRGMCGKGAVCSARGAAKLKKAPSGAFQEVKQLALMLPEFQIVLLLK